MKVTTNKTKKLVSRTENSYVTLEARLRVTDPGNIAGLSITGEAGDILSKKEARRLAFEHWVNYFEYDAEEYEALLLIRNHGDEEDQKRIFDKSVGLPNLATEIVLRIDGEFHGLDVSLETEDEVWIAHSCGQIREELEAEFPEHSWVFKYHLNDMRAECEHQRKLGWRHGKDICLNKDELTTEQRRALYDQAKEAANYDMLDSTVPDLLGIFRRNPAEVKKWLGSALDRSPTNNEIDALLSIASSAKDFSNLRGKADRFLNKARVDARALPLAAARKVPGIWELFLTRTLSERMKNWEPQSQIFKNCLGAPCPECGYRYGTSWLHEELPEEVIKWFHDLKDHEIVHV